MPISRFSPFGIAAVSLVLSGCGSLFGPEGIFRDRGEDYLKAQTEPVMTLPKGATGSNIGQLFVIPPIKNTSAALPAEFEVPRPASSGRVAEQSNEVKIQKLGGRRWIDINNPPEEVWPGVRTFLADKGMGIATQDPASGTLETVWLALEDSPSVESGNKSVSSDRYRIQLEPGLRTDSTEIHVLQMTASSLAEKQGGWPAQSTNPGRESWLIKELAESLAQSDMQQASMMAQSIGSSEQRVKLLQYPEPGLSMRVDYARAWASVGGSLNRDGFHVDSANREQGIWNVSFSPVNTSESNNENKVDETGVLTRITSALGLSGDDKVEKNDNAADYQVLLQQQPDGNIRVMVRDSNGGKLASADADRLLRRIRDNLL